MKLLRNKSLEIKTGLRISFEIADSKVANRVCYGYFKLDNGELAINETETEIVRSYSTATIMAIA